MNPIKTFLFTFLRIAGCCVTCLEGLTMRLTMLMMNLTAPGEVSN